MPRGRTIKATALVGCAIAVVGISVVVTTGAAKHKQADAEQHC